MWQHMPVIQLKDLCKLVLLLSGVRMGAMLRTLQLPQVPILLVYTGKGSAGATEGGGNEVLCVIAMFYKYDSSTTEQYVFVDHAESICLMLSP